MRRRVWFAAGCVLDADSDAMLSSGSVLTSSAGGSDDVMDESWLQQQQQQQPDIDERQPDAGTSPQIIPALDHCPLDAGNRSRTAAENMSRSCHGDNTSRTTGSTESAAIGDPITGSRTSVSDSSYTDRADLDSHPHATSADHEPFKPSKKESIKIASESNQTIYASATTEDDSEQNSQKLVDGKDDEGAVEKSVSTSKSAADPLLSTADAMGTDTRLDNMGLTSGEIHKKSKLVVQEAGTMSADEDSCHISSTEPPPHTATESSVDEREIKINSKDAEDADQASSSGVDSGETDASSDVRMRTQTTDNKNAKQPTTASKQRLQSNKEKTSSKKKTDSSKSTVLTEETKGKLDVTTNGRSSTTAHSSGLASSKERRLRGSADTEQPRKMATEKLKLGRENDKTIAVNPTSSKTARGQRAIEARQSSKSSSSTQKASDKTETTESTSSGAVGRRDRGDRPWNQTKKPKKETAGSGTEKEIEKTPDGAENSESLSTAASKAKKIAAERNEPRNADDQEKKAGDKAGKSKMITASNNSGSTDGTKLPDSARNPGKGTSLSTRKSSAVRINPGPEDTDKDTGKQHAESRATIGKRRTKSTGLNMAVDRPVSGGTDAADRTENPGNPRSVGDGVTTSGERAQGESRDSSLPTKRPQQQRSAGSRSSASTADKPTTSALPGKTTGPKTKTTYVTQDSEKSIHTSKTTKSTGKRQCSTRTSARYSYNHL